MTGASVAISGSEPEQLRELAGWLRGEGELRGREVTLQAGSADEAQAVLAEVRRVLDGGA
ncbi:hypothetical protein [Crossiella cryophila]|uniref:Uncharacterized protein n=1 Tax=Crossiella cryophila TaxID=43355 RepID=A0A7W7FUE1_9PSEU|nr:hypothetical protein [Crossiella cryophila]MBB4677363.1 hypothetical protein [Crossiella cryophila]